MDTSTLHGESDLKRRSSLCGGRKETYALGRDGLFAGALLTYTYTMSESN